MDGFTTSHMLSEALTPEPELLSEFLGVPRRAHQAPDGGPEMLFGAKGRVFQLQPISNPPRADFGEGEVERGPS